MEVSSYRGVNPRELPALARPVSLQERCLYKCYVCLISLEKCLSLRSLPQEDNRHRVVSAVKWCLIGSACLS